MRALALILFAAVVLASCADTPPPPADMERSVVASRTEDGFVVSLGEEALPLSLLDPWRVARLARAVFPDLRIVDAGDVVTIEVDSPESARALLQAARWTDALIAARRQLEVQAGPAPATNAGVIAETIRRWLLPEPSGALPNWGALSGALDDESVWQVSPVTAGMGSLVFAGMILRGNEASVEGRDKAKVLLSRAVAMRNVPEWLSWIAYLAWSRRDFLANEPDRQARSSIRAAISRISR